MKYEAMKHQGKKGGGNTLDEVGKTARESAKTVQRYIWLTRLSDGLLNMVDQKKLGVSQGVDISFLTEEQQDYVWEILQELRCSVSSAQSNRLKEYGKTGELTPVTAREILTEKKIKDRRIIIREDKIKNYFPEGYSRKEMEQVIIQLLEDWKNRQ